MKKKEEGQEVEILKAVAQAWHSRSGNPRPMKEFDALRHTHHSTRPSRFRLEAINMASKQVAASATWDFADSLWDSYELVTLSRKLESKLVMDHPFEGGPPKSPDTPRKKRKESKNSLRSLFGRTSSKRYDADVPPKDDGPHSPDSS
ncbi:hypothetical protein AAC387_Pa02g3628 [Persea americana]|eukprot:TRINITY_DN10020_c0_g1_i1.p1 TRINITY_DN10020_c0_g1~~TRINITY_DN10020_c0_g1_i1.p1  ORF type:complete len:147 (-),score=34.15 TRINITY_DN10020_c0_g1_i1:488-928(-)